MTVAQMAAELGLTAFTPLPETEVTGAVASDLISDVLANGDGGQVWITIQTHRNVAAVAATLGLAAVLITGGRQPEPELLRLAASEEVAVLGSEERSYAMAGRLYACGIR
ncbi:MAG: serine kinase [Armatimonadetes bacterium]|nr:serine kinase [Armatimonadota bacterium]